MGIVYYAQYLVFFERARSEYIRSRGISYAEVEQKGILLPVREAQCRYRAPARYDDLIFIRAAISRWGRASLNFEYEIWNEDKNLLLAQGSTQHAVVDRTARPVPAPQWFLNLFKNEQVV